MDLFFTIVICDLCEEQIYDERSRELRPVEIEVTKSTCSRLPDGSISGRYESVDLCETCYAQKLRPWLTSEGATFEERTSEI